MDNSSASIRGLAPSTLRHILPLVANTHAPEVSTQVASGLKALAGDVPPVAPAIPVSGIPLSSFSSKLNASITLSVKLLNV